MYKNIDEFKTDFLSKLYNYVKSYYQTLDRNKEYVIWGAGKYGRFALSVMEELNLSNNIKCFCQSSNERSCSIIEGYPLNSIEKAYSLHPKAVFLLENDFVEEIIFRIKNQEKYRHLSYLVADNNTRKAVKEYLNLIDKENRFSAGVFENIYKWYNSYKEVNKQIILKGKITALGSQLSEINSLLEDEQSRFILTNRISSLVNNDPIALLKNPVDTPQYFSREYLPYTEDEVFFDCGAFTGDSILEFCSFTQLKYKKIAAFEPDPCNAKKLSLLVKDKNLANVLVVKAATGISNCKLPFVSTPEDMSSHISRNSEEGGISVDVIKLDNFISENPTIIKMDIEGAELDSLKGASEIISSLKPKLAICIYHKAMDFYDITTYLKKLVPEYHFKIRQHEDGIYETVLYAWS